MSNPFSNDSLVPLWKTASEILKGDFAGHPFRGNQYQEGSLQDTASRLAQHVTNTRTNISPMDARDIAQAHEDHAGVHKQIADALRQSADNVALNGMGNVPLANQMLKEASLHDAAASAHMKASDTVLKAQGEYGGRLGLNEKAPSASQVSASSNAAMKATLAASGTQTNNLLGGQTPDIQLPLGAPYYGG